MASPSIRPLHDAEVSYIRAQLDHTDPQHVKRALQDLSKLYRRGFRIRPETLSPVQNSIFGLLFSFNGERKVVRWALNTLARLGRARECEDAIRHVLANHYDDPDVVAAAIAALFKLNSDPAGVLKKLAFDPQMVALAALQHVAPEKLDLSSLPLPIDTASPELLKLALVVVGLDRTPKRLFHPRYSNAQMVKAMGRHHDPIVVQYSIWAITENPRLTLSSLGVSLKDFERYPANVKSWLMQLIGSNAPDAAKYFDVLAAGAGDASEVVRSGLALGLRETYFDGLDPVVLEWLSTEQDEDVRQLLLDHLVRQSDRSQHYVDWVTTTYRAEPVGSRLRRRIEFAARGLNVSNVLRQIAAEQEPDLFRGVTIVAGDQVNIGNVQGAAVSVTGTANNSGQQVLNMSPQALQAINGELERAERALQAADVDNALKQTALAEVQAARQNPSQDRVAKVIDVLGKVEAVSTKATAAGSALGTALSGLAHVAKTYGWG